MQKHPVIVLGAHRISPRLRNQIWLELLLKPLVTVNEGIEPRCRDDCHTQTNHRQQGSDFQLGAFADAHSQIYRQRGGLQQKPQKTPLLKAICKLRITYIVTSYQRGRRKSAV